MKKRLLLLFISILTLAGCTSSKTEDVQPEASKKSANAPTETVSYESDSVELMIPASYYSDKDADAVINDFKANGVEDAWQNADGSFTLTMTHDLQMLFKVSVLNSVKTQSKETPEDGFYPAIKEIIFNEDLTHMEILADKQSFNEESDRLKVAEIANLMTYYQIFDNVPENQVHLEVTLKDEASGSVFKTLTFN
ncbi:hypothetical protein QWT69_13160 [Sporosarcina oncorhynchi]|uniref:Uncharacterized protein n=1 Tax=Sporosarcina oncorhynchi TaxID=3056444 RepID=A0ABZ0L2H3_9BACL|nr:hypothetical protein [Sporosarcina sp. T2O-4]WOV86812.1 hypothetical protein QWT69_13160 [Sporosarcina sp. T2O-4]